jgi:hypothetical protein
MSRPSDLLADLSADRLARRPERSFSEEEAKRKRLLYESMSVKRRRFVDRIGFDAWDPFEAPKEPLDMRMDLTERTVQELVRDFLRSVSPEMRGGEYARGATECALGLMDRREKYMGMLDFCVWYHELLQKEQTSK